MLQVIGILCLLVFVHTVESYRNCFVNGSYKRHDDTWSNATLTCVSYRCNDGTVAILYSGCLWNDKCYRPGKTWKAKCAKMKCVRSHEGDYTFYEVKSKTQCLYKGRCKSNGSTWKDKCDNLKCRVEVHGQVHTTHIDREANCRYKNKCYSHHQIWKDKCLKFTCIISETSEGYTKEVKQIPACEHNGRCYKLGTKRKESQCHVVECRVEKGKVGWRTQTIGCSSNGRCVPAGKTVEDGKSCTKSTCTHKKRGKKNLLKLKSSKTGCRHRDKCIKFGSTYTNSDCEKYKCVGGPKKPKLSLVKIGCLDNTKQCKDYGDKFAHTVRGRVFPECTCQKLGKRGSKTVCTVASRKET